MPPLRNTVDQRVASIAVVVLAVACSLVTATPTAFANSCALPPDLSSREMIRKHTTGSEFYDTLVLGKVVTIKDVDPGKGGDKIAKLAVAASPVGYAPLVARVRFWKPERAKDGEPMVSDDYGINYQPHRFYAVVAHRRDNGSFQDDSACGNTKRITRDRLWSLVRYNDNH